VRNCPDLQARLSLGTAALLISLGCLTAACSPAVASNPRSAPAKYFGDEFAEAQRALAAKPLEEAAPTF